MEKIAVIVAGGLGTRMSDKTPKQFLLLGGQPILMRTIRVFHNFDPDIRLIIVLQPPFITEWENLCSHYKFDIPCEVRLAGETRFHSVKNGIKNLPDNCLVAIHDGVRPLVSFKTIDRCFKTAKKFGNAIPCIEIPETMRNIKGEISHQVDRNEFRLIQTPQVFEVSILKKAYEQIYKPEFTDDAGVVERMGVEIKLVEGNPENIKITLKKDLKIAEALFKVY